jgi:DHA1 family multidrug resistance protein-like MFS transporter
MSALDGRLGKSRLRSALGTPWVRVVVVLTAAQMLSELAFSFALPFTPLYIQKLGVEDVTEAGLWAGLMAGVFAVAMGGMAPVWGVVADRFGHRLMIQRAFLGAGLSIALMAFVQTPEQLLVLRVAHGVFTGVVTAIATLVSLTVPRRYLGTILGLLQAAQFLGISLGPLLGGAFADLVGLRYGFAVTGITLFTMGILVTLVVRDVPREARRTEAAAPDAAPERLITPNLLAVVTLMAIVRFVNVAPQPVLPLFVQEMVGTTEALGVTVGIVLAATGVASTVSALLVGRLSDRYGWRPLLLGCVALTVAVAPFHLLIASVWQLVLLRIATGFALGGMSPAIQALLIQVTPARRRGAAFGLLTTANAVGNGGGPVAGSVVAAAYGVPAVFVATMPVMGLAAWILVRLRLAEPKRSNEPAPST